MKSVFEKALEYTFVNEGGFSNDAADHGGATAFGITRAEAARWRKKPVSVAEMKVFPIDEAKAIYKAWYWDTMRLDEVVKPGIAICMFDIGVVMGIGIPPKFAQAVCNANGSALTVDGHIGPLTIAQLNLIDQATFVKGFAAKAEARFRGIVENNASQRVFLKGWLNRAHRLLTLANV